VERRFANNTECEETIVLSSCWHESALRAFVPSLQCHPGEDSAQEAAKDGVARQSQLV